MTAHSCKKRRPRQERTKTQFALAEGAAMNSGILALPDIAHAKYGLRFGIWASKILMNVTPSVISGIGLMQYQNHYNGVRPPLWIFSVLFLSLPVISTATAQRLGDLTDRFATVEPLATETAGKTRSTSFTIQNIDGSFNGFVLKGNATGNYRQGFTRFFEDGRWSGWKPLRYMEADLGPTFLSGYRDENFRENVIVELRFDTELIDSIEITEFGVFDNRNDDDALATISKPAVELPLAQGAVIPPNLIPRSEWGARPFAGNPVPLAQPSYTRMTFHHTAGLSPSTYQEGITRVKAIQDFHQDVRGWSDIGYHFLFDAQGRLYQGRPFLDNRTNLDRPPVLAQGAHVGGANTGNIGVSLMGCFHPPEGNNCIDVASPALIDSVVTLYAYLSEQYRVDAADLFGHRDQGATACPGDNNYALLPDVRTRIRALIASGNEPIAAASLHADADEEGVVRLAWSFSSINDVARYRIDRSTRGDTITVFQTSDLTAIQTVDATPPTSGNYEYHLFATSSTGREQRLSTAIVDVNSREGFVLTENFPNPVTSSTTIRYYLEHDGIVHLLIYDASGRLIETLVSEFQDGDQWYASEFNTFDLASGTYFFRLRVEGFSDVAYDKTRTMQILRQ